jgi:hypothetical protein
MARVHITTDNGRPVVRIDDKIVEDVIGFRLEGLADDVCRVWLECYLSAGSTVDASDVIVLDPVLEERKP